MLLPAEAVELVRGLTTSWQEEGAQGYPFVVGVAGPGEPLANDGTFAALAQVHTLFPSVIKCISTNGLLLAPTLPRLLKIGVRAVTVTVNAPDSTVGEQIYAWVRYQGKTYRRKAAAELLIDSQIRGIRAALDAELTLKVNTVLIPGINDRVVTRLARLLSDLGVRLMNIMPLMPGGQMADRRAPTCEELAQARSACQEWVPQVRWCEQCRADVIRTPQHRG
jgi:nitrogen fixation protein NifB